MAGDRRRRLREWSRRNELRLAVATLSLLFLIVYLSPRIFISIYPGHAGVRWSRFGGGTVTSTVYDEGLHVIFPWDVMYVYDIRLEERAAVFDVLSSDGVHMKADVVVRFRPLKPSLPILHKYMGPEYVRTLVLPQVGARVREEIGRYEPEQLYAQRRDEIQRLSLEKVRAGFELRYLHLAVSAASLVYVEDVLVRTIILPPQVEEAISHKLAQKHMMLEYDYRLLKEQKEAERKRIEAMGIRSFQDIVAEGISDRYLRWKGIDATLELARSNNSKIIVIGAGNGGLPIILGNLEPAAAAAAGAATAPPPRPAAAPGPAPRGGRPGPPR